MFLLQDRGGFGTDGALSIAWRHVYAGNMRDIAFMTSRDGGRTFSPPVRVSEDRWSTIAGCPDDGPALAVDSQNRVHVVWPTVIEENAEPTKALFHAVSADGVRFSPRVRIPTKRHANHPHLAIAPDGSLTVIWDESGDGKRWIALARGAVDASGRAVFERDEAAGGEPGVYPTVAYTSDGRRLQAWVTGPPADSVIRLTRTR